MSRHAKHAAPRRRAAWRPLAAAAIGASILLVSGQGVWAGLRASATNTTPQSATSGTLALTMAANGTGFTQPVGGLAPGDVVNRYVDLTSSGTLAAQGSTFAVASTGAAVLITDATRGLRLTVTSCSATWNASTGACSGTTTVLVPQTLLGALSTPVALLPGSVAAGSTARLQISLRLPDQDETTVNGTLPTGTVQGQSASLTYTFAQVQRTAATTNS